MTSGGNSQELAGLLVGLGPLARKLRLAGDARQRVDHGEDGEAALLAGNVVVWDNLKPRMSLRKRLKLSRRLVLAWNRCRLGVRT